MRGERDVERVDPQTLEIAIIERFKSALSDLRDAGNTNESETNPQNSPNSSVLSTYADGVHYLDFGCPVHASSEIFTATHIELGEIVGIKATNFSVFPDGTIDEITAIADGEIKVENGLLVTSDNSALVQKGVERLQAIRKDIVEDQDSETKAEAEATLKEARKLMGELTSLYQGEGLWFEGPGKKKGWASVEQNSLTIGTKGEKSQFELSYGEGFFRAVQYFWSSEQPEIIEYGQVKKDAQGYTIDNPAYLEKSLRALKNVRSLFAQKGALKIARGQLVKVLIAQARPF